MSSCWIFHTKYINSIFSSLLTRTYLLDLIANFTLSHTPSPRLGTKELHEHHGVKLFFRFSAKFGSLNMHIRNNFKNIIFIACKWCKICKYYVNSMVISCSTCQKEEKECIWVNIWLRFFLSQFQICRNLHFFLLKIFFPKFLEFTLNLHLQFLRNCFRMGGVK